MIFGYLPTKIVCSSACRGTSHASQSDRVVLEPVSHYFMLSLRASTYGNKPIPLTFQSPRANTSKLQTTYVALTIISFPLVPSPSNLVNTWRVCNKAWNGFLNSMKTIMMLNICSEFPDMYIMIAFIGIDFAGAIANSHAFLSLSVSVSSVVGGLRMGCFEEER